jgi:hypothetical protein
VARLLVFSAGVMLALSVVGCGSSSSTKGFIGNSAAVEKSLKEQIEAVFDDPSKTDDLGIPENASASVDEIHCIPETDRKFDCRVAETITTNEDSNTDYETVSILVSEDGQSWIVASG